MNLSQVARFRVPANLVEQTEASLQEAGAEGFERFVLWSGVIAGDSAEVRTIHVPKQTAYKTSEGLLVRVEGDALHKLNVWLYEHDEVLAAQVHAHPTDAFHSITDNTYPIVTALGSLSLVAPDFAYDGVICRRSAAYRLTSAGWVRIPRRKLSRLLEVTG